MLRLVASVNNEAFDLAWRSRGCGEARQCVEPGEKIGRDRLSGFGFHGGEGPRALDDEIDFGAFAVAEERECRRQPWMHSRLQHLRGDPTLEDRAAQGVLAQLICGPDAEPVSDHAGIEEVELRGLDQSFPEVGVQGRQSPADVSGLQH